MRIKIIGDSDCARATRHLVRLAGFAVTEFIPGDAIIDGPLAGYTITIDLAPATHTPDTHLRPDPSTHHSHSTAKEEATRLHRDASSPALASAMSRSGGEIHFDSVDSALEEAVLRHVTQLAGAPVILDRPGGALALVSLHSRFAAEGRGAAGARAGMALPVTRDGGVPWVRRSSEAGRGGMQIVPCNLESREGAGAGIDSAAA